MFTRQQRMANECTHEEYYQQFVTPNLVDFVVGAIGKDRIAKSEDPHLNDIPLIEWDRLHNMVAHYIIPKLKEIGQTGISLSDTVCAAKQAARSITDMEVVG